MNLTPGEKYLGSGAAVGYAELPVSYLYHRERAAPQCAGYKRKQHDRPYSVKVSGHFVTSLFFSTLNIIVLLRGIVNRGRFYRETSGCIFWLFVI